MTDTTIASVRDGCLAAEVDGLTFEAVGIHSIENGQGTMDNGQGTMENGEWFDLSGRKIPQSSIINHHSSLKKGIYLLRQGDGYSRKVYIK